MSTDHPAAPEDVGRAGRGDLVSLRRMRDHWMDLATGAAVCPLLPRDEALPQLELLAEMAACASGEPEDWIVALIAYQVRVETLRGHVDFAQELAKVAASAENVPDLDRWTRLVVEHDERLAHYSAKIGSLLTEVVHSANPEGPAMLIAAMSLQADRGDERAVPMLQAIMDTVPRERAQAVIQEVRKIEGARVQ